MRLPAQRAIVYPVNVAQEITVNRMRALVRRDETAGEILRLLHRAVAADEEAVALHGRFPFRRKTGDRRPLKFSPEKIW